MQVNLYIVAAGLLYLIAPAAAQGTEVLDALQKLPQCAISCIAQNLPKSECGITDFSCICNNENLWQDAGACTLNACSTRDALMAQNITKASCGVPVRNHGRDLPIVGGILFGLSFAFIVIRILARSQRRFELAGLDDVLIVLSFVSGAPLLVVDIFLCKYGIGQDLWNIPYDSITKLLLWFYIGEMPYLYSTVLTKLSIMAFYLRVFIDYKFRRVVYCVTGALVLFTIAFTFALVFQCTPVSRAWEGWQKEVPGKCININAGTWSHAALNILFDLIVLALPIPQFMNLQCSYSLRSKIQIVVMFGVGILVTITSILRLRSLVMFASTKNPSWDYFGAGLWSVIEVYVGVVCACLPTARIFAMRVLPKWIGLSSWSSSKNSKEAPQKKQYTRKVSKYPMSWTTQQAVDSGIALKPINAIETSVEFGTAEFHKLEDTPPSTDRPHLFRPQI